MTARDEHRNAALAAGRALDNLGISLSMELTKAEEARDLVAELGLGGLQPLDDARAAALSVIDHVRYARSEAFNARDAINEHANRL